MKTYKQIGTEIGIILGTDTPFVKEGTSSWVYYTALSGFDVDLGYYSITVYEMTNGTKKIEVIFTTERSEEIGDLVKAIAGDEPVEISVKRPAEYDVVII